MPRHTSNASDTGYSMSLPRARLPLDAGFPRRVFCTLASASVIVQNLLLERSIQEYL